jgi:hypothetical protein
VLRVLLFGLVFFVAWSQLVESSVGPVWRFCGALLVALLAILLLAVYPMLRFKQDERTLTISTSGITTTIGNLSGDVPWSKVGRIEHAERCIYIFGQNGNSFTIPHRAFPTENQRAEFLRRATQWWDDARRSNKPLALK